MAKIKILRGQISQANNETDSEKARFQMACTKNLHGVCFTGSWHLINLVRLTHWNMKNTSQQKTMETWYLKKTHQKINASLGCWDTKCCSCWCGVCSASPQVLRLSLRNILLLCGFTHFFCNSLLFLLLFLLLLLLLLLELSRMPPWESKRAGDGWRGFGGRAQRLGAVAVAAEDATVCHSTFLLPSLLPRTCCIKYYCLRIKHLVSLPDLLASLLPWFL